MLGATILVALSVVQSVTAVPSEVVTSDPIELFNQVCLADEVRLAADKYGTVKHAEMPRSAREALGFSLPKTTPALPGAKNLSLRDEDVPNRVLALLPSKRIYLMLAANPGQSGRAADQCAVIWNDRAYASAVKAARVVRPISPAVDAEPVVQPIAGYGFTVIRSKGAVVAATEFGDWTVLRVGPDTSPEEQTTR